MQSDIIRFRIMRDSWEDFAEIDLSESNCCVLTGGNGQGKTLMMKLLNLVGIWHNNPNRYNTMQIENLCKKADVKCLELDVRTELINGHGPFSASVSWIKDWSFDQSKIYPNNASDKDPSSVVQDIKSSNEFLIDVYLMNQIRFDISDNTSIKLRHMIGINYLIRDYIHMDEMDLILKDQWTGFGENIPFTPIYDPLDFAKTQEYGSEVNEYAELFEVSDFTELSDAELEKVNLSYAPNINNNSTEFDLIKILGNHGILIESDQKPSPSTNQSKLKISQPIILKVDRTLSDINSDMEQIRSTQERLSNPVKCKEIVQSGWKNYVKSNRTMPTPSLFLHLDKNEKHIDSTFEITEHLGKMDAMYITTNEPFFPSLWAFKKFLGKVPDGNYLSSGQLQLLSMTKAVISSNPNSLIMIDEPELSLHIDWQRKLINFMSEAFPNRRFIFATHSPDILYYQEDNVIQIPPVEW